METVEHRLALIVRNARSRIIDTDGHTVSDTPDAHFDPAPFPGKLACVVDDDGGKALYESLRRLYRERARTDALDRESHVVRRGHGAESLDACVRRGGDVGHLECVSGHRFVVGASKPQKVLDNPPEPRALFSDALQDVPIGDRITGPIQRKIDFRFDD
jgi:hypothetical protein